MCEYDVTMGPENEKPSPERLGSSRNDPAVKKQLTTLEQIARGRLSTELTPNSRFLFRTSRRKSTSTVAHSFRS